MTEACFLQMVISQAPPPVTVSGALRMGICRKHFSQIGASSITRNGLRGERDSLISTINRSRIFEWLFLSHGTAASQEGRKGGKGGRGGRGGGILRHRKRIRWLAALLIQAERLFDRAFCFFPSLLLVSFFGLFSFFFFPPEQAGSIRLSPHPDHFLPS